MSKNANKTKTTKTLANNNTIFTITVSKKKKTDKKDYAYKPFDDFYNGLTDGSKIAYHSVDKTDVFTHAIKSQSDGVAYYDLQFTIAQNIEQYAKLQSIIDGNAKTRNEKRNANTKTAETIDGLTKSAQKKHFEKIADAGATLTSGRASIVRALKLAIDSIDFVQASADEQKTITAQASAKIALATMQNACLQNLNAPKAKTAIATLAKDLHIKQSMIDDLLTKRITDGTNPQSKFDNEILQKALDVLTPMFDVVAPPIEMYNTNTDGARKHTADANALEKALKNITKAFDNALAIINAQ